MNKPIRKAVRTYLIEENNIVAIKYKKQEAKDFYDIPGGKIEENELSFETSIREFKEEMDLCQVFRHIFMDKLLIRI